MPVTRAQRRATTLLSQSTSRKRANSSEPEKKEKRPRKFSNQGAASKSSTPILDKILSDIKSRYQAAADPVYADSSKKYLRNQFEFYGIKFPARRAIDKEIVGIFSISDFDGDGTRQLLLLLWQQPQREYKYFAIDLAKKLRSRLAGTSVAECQKSLECLQTLLTTASWWDTVDLLASQAIGHLAKEHPMYMRGVLDQWISEKNLWLRRTAIIHQLNYNINTDKQILFRYCLLQCHDEDFFIKKSIGWALRNYHRHDPAAVEVFVKENENKLSALSKKEALKHAR